MARRLRRTGAVLAIVGLLLGAAGCGGDGEPAETKPTLTKRQFARQAHSVCYRLSKKQVRRIEAFSKRHGFDTGEPGRRERERINAAVVMPIVEEKIEQLKALSAPAGEEGEVKKIIESMEEGLRVSEAHPEWLAAPTAAHPDPFMKTIELTAAYGIWVCGQA